MRCNELITFGNPNGFMECLNCGTTYSRELYPVRCVAVLIDGAVVGTL